jgi:hypothetical protein
LNSNAATDLRGFAGIDQNPKEIKAEAWLCFIREFALPDIAPVLLQLF